MTLNPTKDWTGDLSTLQAATFPEESKRTDREPAGQDGVDDCDDSRLGRDVNQEEQPHRDEKHHRGENEHGDEKLSAGADLFEEPSPKSNLRVFLDSGHGVRREASRADRQKVPGPRSSPKFVEYCVSNVTGETRRRVEDLPCETQAYPCLERCGTCHERPFLVVDGTEMIAHSHGALRRRIGDDQI